MKIISGAFYSILVCGLAFAQAPPPTSAQVEPQPNVLPPQRLGPGDLVSVSVYAAPELSRPVRVATDGTVRLPMLNQPVKAGNEMPDQLAKSISEELKSEKLMVDPLVSVTVYEYLSRPVIINGAVRHPTTFQAFGDTTLLTALAKADGLAPEAGPDLIVNVPQTGPDGERTGRAQTVSIKSLMSGSDPNLNVELHGGEVITVPVAPKVYVVGNVKKPGAYAVQDATATSVLKMLAACEGLSPYATKEAYIYRQAPGNSQKEEIPVPLLSIMQRKSPDVTLHGGDIFYIPDNRSRRLAVTVLERIAGFGANTASGVLIWH
jgi:polysaccharide export outer membrane protein